MKIYFTASTSVNGELSPFYKLIITYVKNHHVVLVSGEQIVNKELLEKDKTLGSTLVFERQKKRIDEADLIIAETSKPSLGVGGEIVYALTSGKPVLALINTQFEDAISPMLVGNPSDNLFIEHYDADSLRHKINEFIRHIVKIKKRKGKLIVIDGGDGSGKTTQAQMLVEYLKSKKIPVKYVDFPQYRRTFHGKTVERFLKGEFGGIDQVSPYLASLAYAIDRASAKREMDDFLALGGVIVANRYATSSMAHQAAKFTNPEEQNDFLKWIYELEYKVHKIPKENMVVYLHVPYQFAADLVQKRAIKKGVSQDIAEKSLDHQKKSEEMYLTLAKKYKHWKTIDCVQNGVMMDRQSIQNKIHELVGV